ncbi:MAG: trigger factor [Nitrospirota bacterium]
MKVAVDDLSAVKKTLRVEIPQEVVTEEFSHAYASLNRRVRLPGFRPGKAPRALLEQRYAKEVEDEILRKLIPDYYQRAIAEAGLKPVELPDIGQVQLREGAPLVFSATVEVKPAITLGDYRGLPVQPEAVMVTEADLDEALGRVQERFAQLQAHPADHAAATGDFVVLDLEGRVDGEPLPGGSVKGGLFEVGKGALKEPLEEAVLGRVAGEQVEARLKLGPEAQPSLRDKEAIFSITIQAVKRKVLPPVDDELAKDAGAESLSALRQRLREELERARRKEAEAKQKQALVKQLIDRHQFIVPAALVDHELNRIYGRVHPHDAHGHDAHAEEAPSPEAVQQFRATYEPVATDRVKGTLLLEAIAADAGLSVADEEVTAELQALAAEMKMAPEQLRRLLLRQDGTLAQLRRKVLEDKTLDYLLAQAAVAKSAET